MALATGEFPCPRLQMGRRDVFCRVILFKLGRQREAVVGGKMAFRGPVQHTTVVESPPSMYGQSGYMGRYNRAAHATVLI